MGTDAYATPSAPAAPLPSEGSELTVQGEAGALLFLDGMQVGRLPLPTPLMVPPGPHRYMLERAGRRFESDVLTIPEGRTAELSLTRGSKGSAIAVLSLVPMVMYALGGESLDVQLRQSVLRAVQDGARAEHTVLVRDSQAALAAASLPADCLQNPECALKLAAKLNARMLLLLQGSTGGPPPAATAPATPPCRLSGELYDVATGQVAARDVQTCAGADERLDDLALRLTRKLLGSAAKQGKGTLAVSSNLPDAEVYIDGRLRGTTPFTGSSIPGARQLDVRKAGHPSIQKLVSIVSGQTLTVSADFAMQPVPVLPPPPVATPPRLVPHWTFARRPVWRYGLGGVALAGGVVMAGFGSSALSRNGDCADLTASASGLCETSFATTGVGGGLLAAGLLIAAGGAALIAAPGPRIQVWSKE